MPGASLIWEERGRECLNQVDNFMPPGHLGGVGISKRPVGGLSVVRLSYPFCPQNTDFFRHPPSLHTLQSLMSLTFLVLEEAQDWAGLSPDPGDHVQRIGVRTLGWGDVLVNQVCGPGVQIVRIRVGREIHM